VTADNLCSYYLYFFPNFMSSSALSTLRLASRTNGRLLQPYTRPCLLRTVQPTIYARLPTMSSHSFHRTAFQSAEAGDPMQGIDPNHPFIQQLRKNPHILEQLAEFTVLLQEKGLDVSSGKQPGFGQVSLFRTSLHDRKQYL
jgi:hypothetical protein